VSVGKFRGPDIKAFRENQGVWCMCYKEAIKKIRKYPKEWS
jgi:hypothetical protein